MAHDRFQTMTAMHKAYARKRTPQWFILEGARDLRRTKCAHCGEPLSEHGDTPNGYRSNRCVYDPKTKTVTAAHYTCSWDSLMAEVAKITPRD